MLALYTAPKPAFMGSIPDYDLSMSFWQCLQGGVRVQCMNTISARINRVGTLSPSFVVRCEYVEPIERDEYSAEWLAYLEAK